MGSSEFAIPAFKEIQSSTKHQIIAAYTRQPKESGRGMKLQLTPIHQLALEKQIPVFTPKNFNNDQDFEQFASLNADLAIVISYGILLPKRVLEATKYGCFNLHPSDLPNWRGAAPIQRCLMAGDKKTAVCVIKMNEGLDSGDIVKNKAIQLLGNENYPELFALTAKIGAKQILEILDDLPNGKIEFRAQNSNNATYASKILKSECLIDWRKSGAEILRQIRALSGNLSAHFFYDSEQIKLIDAEFLPNESKNKISPSGDHFGKIVDKNFLISCNDGVIKPKILQRPGKKPLELKEFLLGFKPEIGKKLNF